MAYQPTEWEHGDIITGGKLNKIEEELTHVSDNAIYGFGGAQLSSDGLTPFSYINAGDPMPANPQKGDTVFLKDGNDFLIYSYNGEDWVLKIDPDLSNRIEETIKTASDNTDKAIADNNTQINETINQVAKEQADLAVKDGDFNNKAQVMADKALSDAKANMTAVAKETLDTATENLDAAKKSLTTDLQKEVSDRTTAVAALDTKAQGYADTAKQNAIDVATSADGVINKKIDDTASSITSTVSQNKKDAEGKITTAQSIAIQALNGLSSKVDTSTYNAKTGQLSTDVTNVTQTANQAKTDIASIKQTNTSQDARMTTIEADANGTKTTVSNLQTTQGKQSGDISTLQQRADGFDATVTKVNNLPVGGTNLFVNTATVSSSSSLVKLANTTVLPITTQQLSYPSIGETKITKAVNGEFYYRFNAPTSGNMVGLTAGTTYTISFDVAGDVPYLAFRWQTQSGSSSWPGDNKTGLSVSTTYHRVSVTFTIPANATGIYLSLQAYSDAAFTNLTVDTGKTFSFKRSQLELGKTATDFATAPQDVDSATAKAQLTADQATLSINNYKTDADRRISKAQSDITQTANDITTKVSQSDYDKKTGDLSTAVSKAQTTADGVVTTVGNYQTSNDKRVKAAESTIEQHSKDITARVSQTDYDNNNSNLNTRFTKVEATADGASTTVSKLSTTVNNLGQINQLFNTEFSPDLQGWSSSSLSNYLDYIDIKGVYNSSHVLHYNGGTTSRLDIQSQKIKIGNPTQTFSISVLVKGTVGISVVGYKLDSDVAFSSWYTATSANTSYSDWTLLTFNNKSIISGSTTAITSIAFNITSTGNEFWLSEPMMVFSQSVGAYVPGNYNNNTALAQVKITADSISGIVSDPTTGLSTRVQTAEGTLNTVKSTADGAMSKATQTANQITQEISDRTKGDSNTLQSSKDFTTSSVSSAVNGVNSTITQTSDSLIAKINTKTDSDTVLSLLKNNWSIGITDNISKITSGIVGNASQMSIISKNVTIDSPNTQIKGTAWIQSAMIANGAIGSAQIGDATITSAKIADLDVAKLTGNVSNFIQSNWNGLYQSVKISPIGMTISTSQGSTAQFNQDGLVLDGTLGTTNVLNGQIELISSTNEYLGTFQHETMPDHDNVDYLMIKLAGWHTSTSGDSEYDINSDGTNTIRGGDGIGFGITNDSGTYDMLMSWDSSLVAGYKGRKLGWHVEDIMTWHQKGYFENGIDISQNFGGSDQRALHIQGATLSNNDKWYGFFDTGSQAGFGTTATRDVVFYVAGKSYSLYTMLHKLNMYQD